jgi:hypothetical protein
VKLKRKTNLTKGPKNIRTIKRMWIKIKIQNKFYFLLEDEIEKKSKLNKRTKKTKTIKKETKIKIKNKYKFFY